MKTRTLKHNGILVIAASLILLAGAATVVAEEIDDLRSNDTRQGQGISRGDLDTAKRSFDEFAPLVLTGKRDKTSRAAVQQKTNADGSAPIAESPNVDFWIYDATVELFSDLDRDGYYFGVSVEFDADTIYSVAEVYAVLYLSYDYGPWNEYVATENFTIFGASGGDEYLVESELVSGYQTGEYDILIELFDAYDDSFVASFGPDDSSALAYLRLEDAGRDTPPGTTIVVNNGGGGAFGIPGLLALLGLVGLARRRATRG